MVTDARQDAAARAPSMTMVRALASLVERLSSQGTPAAGVPTTSAGERRDAVKEALRSLASAARTGALQCQVDELGMHVNDFIILPAELRAEPTMYGFARRIVSHAVGNLTIRQGAAPGELLTLGRLLAEPPRKRNTGENPSVDVATARNTPTEVLRSWSVLVTPASTPLFTPGPVSPTIGSAVARLRSARSDDATRQAVSDLLDLASDAEGRQDAASVEAIAIALSQHARTVGAGEGRLATEGGLRRLIREGIVKLLAERVPDSADREMLIAILARSGEMGGKALVEKLMSSDERPARRSYFDAIIAQDSGVSQLREALNDSRWYVVRNAAALLGEMGMTDSDAALMPLLAHLDSRIRIAAARALSRLRTARGLLSVQQRLNDVNPEVRRLAAAAFGLSAAIPGAAKPHSGPLGVALATEQEEDVALEMLASLGKLASADAVQRLIRLSLGGPERVAHAGWFRVAALEALVAARGHAAVPTIEVLVSDTDEEVAATARRLLGVVHSA